MLPDPDRDRPPAYHRYHRRTAGSALLPLRTQGGRVWPPVPMRSNSRHDGANMGQEPLSCVELLKKIIDFILEDDWDSRDTNDGRKYHIMGFDAYCWDVSKIPTEEPRKKWDPQPSIDKYVRAITAGDAKDYLIAAKEKFINVGIPDEKAAARILASFIKEASSADRHKCQGDSKASG
jgi:hypothetical protein